jgi:hypothetical protein
MRRVLASANAYAQGPKYAGIAFALFVKGMKAFSGHLRTVCYAH